MDPYTMSTYASPDQVRDFLDVTEEEVTDADLRRPIRLATADIDAAAGMWRVWPDTGLKFLTAMRADDILTPTQRTALTRATAAQVEYRLTLGQDFMVQEQHDSESGPDGGTTGKVRKVTAQVYFILQPVGLIRLHGGPVRDTRRSDLPLA